MQFRDPRQIGRGDRELDQAVNIAAQCIVAAVIKYGRRQDPNDPGYWAMMGELHAIDLIDKAFARRRDDIDGAGSMSIAEREYDVAMDRLRRNLEQMLRTAVEVARQEQRPQYAVLADQVDFVRDYADFLGGRLSTEILPELPDAGV